MVSSTAQSSGCRAATRHARPALTSRRGICSGALDGQGGDLLAQGLAACRLLLGLGLGGCDRFRAASSWRALLGLFDDGQGHGARRRPGRAGRSRCASCASSASTRLLAEEQTSGLGPGRLRPGRRRSSWTRSSSAVAIGGHNVLHREPHQDRENDGLDEQGCVDIHGDTPSVSSVIKPRLTSARTGWRTRTSSRYRRRSGRPRRSDRPAGRALQFVHELRLAGSRLEVLAAHDADADTCARRRQDQ